MPVMLQHDHHPKVVRKPRCEWPWHYRLASGWPPTLTKHTPARQLLAQHQGLEICDRRFTAGVSKTAQSHTMRSEGHITAPCWLC